MGAAQDRAQSETGAGGPAADHLRAEIGRLKRELQQAQARIAELEACADVDPLLDVLNRRGFERALARALAHMRRYGTPAALMFIDLDGFKRINDAHGHAAGDMLLQAVAAALAAHVRASDLVGRLGGDEFGVLLWSIGTDAAAAKARDLERVIGSATVLHGAARLAVGASAGVVALEAAATPAETIAAADRAMYARKRQARG